MRDVEQWILREGKSVTHSLVLGQVSAGADNALEVGGRNDRGEGNEDRGELEDHCETEDKEGKTRL